MEEVEAEKAPKPSVPAASEGAQETRQNPSEGEVAPEPQENESRQSTFLQELKQWYLENHGFDLKVPFFSRRELDLERLWNIVQGFGGSQKVCIEKRWAAVGRAFDPPRKMTNLSFHMKRLYEKHLLQYERTKFPDRAMSVDNEQTFKNKRRLPFTDPRWTPMAKRASPSTPYMFAALPMNEVGMSDWRSSPTIQYLTPLGMPQMSGTRTPVHQGAVVSQSLVQPQLPPDGGEEVKEGAGGDLNVQKNVQQAGGLLGRRLSVFTTPGEESEGTLVGVNKQTGRYIIEYDDGTKEEIQFCPEQEVGEDGARRLGHDLSDVGAGGGQVDNPSAQKGPAGEPHNIPAGSDLVVLDGTPSLRPRLREGEQGKAPSAEEAQGTVQKTALVAGTEDVGDPSEKRIMEIEKSLPVRQDFVVRQTGGWQSLLQDAKVKHQRELTDMQEKLDSALHRAEKAEKEIQEARWNQKIAEAVAEESRRCFKSLLDSVKPSLGNLSPTDKEPSEAQENGGEP